MASLWISQRDYNEIMDKNMRIVIDIPKHAYEECKTIELSEALEGVPFHVIKAVANGAVVKTGKWIRADKDKMKCSNCNVIHFIAQYPHGDINYCPNCGAEMEVENEYM